ncbi:DUF1415 domain-containing protein [Moritella sp. F3]|uniref:DUF1415 domain-containing protein n=1 Tax=Moritella sp. F3 TaxID=2718882 RepID=UPI0018E0F3C7|nr:DUF1415 domain-containing protein [Moritella sp. F3]GIC79397.1 DUF1415 domain-containing protein [Moritella sp. F1]GIC84116.1 DUF1415 domain-containing protein [Moritella sp. F3]
MTDNHEIIKLQTLKWVKDIIVKYNICPFAKKELERKTIHCAVLDTSDLTEILEQVNAEFIHLDTNKDIATTLVVIPKLSESFDDFLDLIDYANDLLEMQDYEGIYQLAHMHPKYRFDDSGIKDAANFTNRSPYPILHIIREDEMARVLRVFPNPEEIPERNIELLREKGFAEIKAELEACFNVEDK